MAREFIGTAILAAVVLIVVAPAIVDADGLNDLAPNAYLLESFDEGWDARWIHSSADRYTGRFKISPTADPELQVPEKNKHYGLTALLPRPLDPSEGLVVQYETKYSKGYECGGSYVKLLTHVDNFSAADLVDTTPYTIMFGPDKCGEPMGKIHLILRHRSPVDGTITEKHLKPQPSPVPDAFPHVYTLIIKPDNTFEVLVDSEVKSSGSLLEKLEPSINPPREVPDPEDKKPEGWVDDDKMPDPEAQQPADWDNRKEIPDEAAVKPKGWLDDEPATIVDPAARKPEDWEEEEDGVWEPAMMANPKCKTAGCGEWVRPMRKNPAYKGQWKAPLIDNPEYKGPWVQKSIPNADFFEDEAPLRSIGKIGAVAFEIWTIDEGYAFDNMYVGNDPEEAARLREAVWKPKHAALKAEAEEMDRADMEERKKKQEELAKLKKGGLGGGVVKIILELFDDGALKPLKPLMAPVLDVIRSSPTGIYVAYGLVMTPMLLIITLVLLLVKQKPAKGTSSHPKKHDVPTADDDEPDEEEEEEAAAEVAVEEEAPEEAEEEVAVEEVVTKKKATPKAASKKKVAKATEISAEEEEEEEEEAKGPATRRRSRRAA